MTFLPTDDLRDDEIFLRLDRTSDAQPEKNWLPAYYFGICLSDGSEAGFCDLRIGHNDKTYIGGNIGYTIYEAFRGHHYALKACRLMFKQAVKHGMDYVTISCQADNYASARTIELAGGVRLENAPIPEDNEMYAEGKREAMVWRVDLRDGCTRNDIKTLDILGANRFDTYSRIRVGCRAIVLNEGKLLLLRETVSGWWLIPGGGLEKGESCAECCVRELEEETGYVVRPIKEFLTINEYYEEYRYISHYFICEVAGKGEQRLTVAEKRRGLVPDWLPPNEALGIFSRHRDYAATSEEKRGSYLREYTALNEYLKTVRQA